MNIIFDEYALVVIAVAISFIVGSGLGYILFKIYEFTNNKKKGSSLCSITEEIGIDD